MADRLEKWIYTGLVIQEHVLRGQIRKVGETLGLVEADHPAGWSKDFWDENKIPHPFADYYSDDMKGKVDIWIINPESLPKSLEELSFDAIAEEKSLSTKILECLDGIEGDIENDWNFDKSTFCKLDKKNISNISDGNLIVQSSVKKKVLEKSIVEKDVEIDRIVKGKIETSIKKKQVIEKRIVNKLFKNQDIKIPKGCRFVSLKRN